MICTICFDAYYIQVTLQFESVFLRMNGKHQAGMQKQNRNIDFDRWLLVPNTD